MRNIDGIIQKEKIPMSLTDRALSKGDILFEKVRISGEHLLFWEEHYLRLMAAMRRLRMEIPMYFTMEYLEREIQKTIDANALEDEASIAILGIYRSGGEKLLPEGNEVHFCIEILPLEGVEYPFLDDPYSIELYKDYRIGERHISAVTSNHKALQIAGAVYARENGYQNCLLLNHKNMLVGALDANLFLVKGNHIKTPRLEDGSYNGIIRKQVISLVSGPLGYSVEEAEISPFELQQMDELFLTNTRIGIRPITQYRKKSYENEVGRRVLGLLNKKIRTI